MGLRANNRNLPDGLLQNNRLPENPVANVRVIPRQINRMGKGQATTNMWPALYNDKLGASMQQPTSKQGGGSK